MSVTDLDEELTEALAEGERKLERLAGELEELAENHGDRVRARLLSLLAQLGFGPTEVAGTTPASAYRDAVTGLYNYRYFQEHLDREIRRADASASPLSLVMLDIDDFRRYRESNGSEVANRALVALARLTGPVLRNRDTAIRYGGEEFVVLLPSTAKGLAGRLGDCLRRRIESHQFPGESDQPGGTLTASAGVATYPGDADNGHELVARADRALYLAKEAGKNQVQLFGDNLRSYRRVEASLSGVFSVLESHAHPLDTVNISQAGMLFLAEHPVAEGAFLNVRLRLPGQPYPLDLLSQVVRIGEVGDDDRREIAVRFVDVSSRDRERLAAWLRRRADGSD